MIGTLTSVANFWNGNSALGTDRTTWPPWFPWPPWAHVDRKNRVWRSTLLLRWYFIFDLFALPQGENPKKNARGDVIGNKEQPNRLLFWSSEPCMSGPGTVWAGRSTFWLNGLRGLGESSWSPWFPWTRRTPWARVDRKNGARGRCSGPIDACRIPKFLWNTLQSQPLPSGSGVRVPGRQFRTVTRLCRTVRLNGSIVG